MSREAIQREFWGEETEIDFERRMNQCIKQIRSALGDNAGHPLYIETIHRHGYKFIAPVVSRMVEAPRPRVVESESSVRPRFPSLAGGGGAAPVVSGAVAPSYASTTAYAEAGAQPVAFYYAFSTGELERAVRVYELWQQTYPGDDAPYTFLGFMYCSLGDWEKGLAETQEAMRRDPSNGANYVNLGSFYESFNQLDEAEAVQKQAEERGLRNEDLIWNYYQLAFLRDDSAQMAQLQANALGKPGVEDLLLAYHADTMAWHGKLKAARDLTERAIHSAQHSDAKEAAAIYQAAAALREVESGDRKQALADANAALRLAPNRDVRVAAALALARAGDLSRTQRLADALDREFPSGTLVQRYWLPAIRAALALQQRDPNRTIELLQVTSKIELGQATGFNIYLCPVYLRGEAYLMLHDGKAAATEFQKFIDHRGVVGNFSWGALARLGLARAYALQAVTDPSARDKARVAYQNFLALWKDADPDIPVYQQAKAEYGRLQ